MSMSTHQHPSTSLCDDMCTCPCTCARAYANARFLSRTSCASARSQSGCVCIVRVLRPSRPPNIVQGSRELTRNYIASYFLKGITGLPVHRLGYSLEWGWEGGPGRGEGGLERENANLDLRGLTLTRPTAERFFRFVRHVIYLGADDVLRTESGSAFLQHSFQTHAYQ